MNEIEKEIFNRINDKKVESELIKAWEKWTKTAKLKVKWKELCKKDSDLAIIILTAFSGGYCMGRIR